MRIPVNQVIPGDRFGDVLGALYRGAGGAGEPGLARAQLDESVLLSVQGGVNPFVTDLMVGFPRPTMTPGQVLFRRVGVPTVSFNYSTFGRERFWRQDTRRGMNAPFKFKRRTYDRATATLERRGFVALADRDELGNAAAAGQFSATSGFVDNFALRKAVEARDEVENDLELVRAGLVTATGNYSLTPITIAGGQEWNDATNGDSRATIQSAAWQLARANNVQPLQIGVMLTHDSLEAAQNDPTLIAALTAGGGNRDQRVGRTPTVDDLRAYWGVGEVQVADFHHTTDGDSFVSAYGDIAVLYLMRTAFDGFDVRETTNDPVVDFAWNQAGGLALDPVFKGVEVVGPATSWLYPWESWVTPALVNPDAWFLVQNTNANI